MTPLEAFRQIVRTLAGDVRFHKLWPAVVETVNPDGSIDMTPDDLDMRGTGLSVFPDPGIPNTTIVPAPGARCLLGFKAGDPRRPYIAEWESGGLGRIGLNGGTRPIARMGDPVELAIPPVVTITGSVSGIQTIPGAPPIVVPIIKLPLLGGVVTVAPPPRAMVQAGNPKLLA